MRVYVPVTFEQLCEPELQVKTGIAVTEKFCEQFAPEDDLEFLEDCAFTQASVLAFLNLKNVNTKILARFIVSLELKPQFIKEDIETPGKVEILELIPWEEIVCVHTEDLEEIENISALLEEELENALETLDMKPLLWFDKNELDTIKNIFTVSL